jgi:hypothetical protein
MSIFSARSIIAQLEISCAKDESRCFDSCIARARRASASDVLLPSCIYNEGAKFFAGA